MICERSAKQVKSMGRLEVLNSGCRAIHLGLRPVLQVLKENPFEAQWDSSADSAYLGGTWGSGDRDALFEEVQACDGSVGVNGEPELSGFVFHLQRHVDHGELATLNVLRRSVRLVGA